MVRSWIRALLLRFLLVGGAMALVLAGVGTLLVYQVGQEVPRDLSALRDYRPPSTCRIFDRHGTLIDEFYLQRRIVVSLSSLPGHVPWAFLAAEDLRFYQHGPVDIPGILRALISNLRGGAVKQGGSSISQQVVKNLFLTPERSYKRKLREAILAFRLERELSKDEILELYLNLIYLGGGNYGVEAAARGYFGKSAAELTLPEVAMIAGLIPAPSRFSPYRSWDTAKERQRLVIRRMVEGGFVDQDTALRALAAPIVLRDRDALTVRQGGAYADHVRQLVRRVFGDRLAFDAGLQVHTALDLELQKVAQEALRNGLSGHRGRQGPLPPGRALIGADKEAFLQQGEGLPLSKDGTVLLPGPGTCFPAMVIPARGAPELRAGPWRFALAREDAVRTVRAGPGSEDPRRPLREVMQPGRILKVCAGDMKKDALPGDDVLDGVVGVDPRPWSEGALAALEPQTGRVRALVGGFEETLEGFNRATQGRRQAGSSFKPFIYASALARGKNQGTGVLDGPLSIGGWSPKNYGGKYGGATTYRTALARSYNTAAVRVGMEVGADEVVRTARALGVSSVLHTDVTLFLGTSEVTPLEMAAAYSGFAAGGRRVDPVFIERVLDNRGRLIVQAGQRVRRSGSEEWVSLPGGPTEGVLSPSAAYGTLDMLGEVVRAGTGKRAALPDRQVVGKTGTTSDYRDAWFVGMSSEIAISVWVGTDGQWSLGKDETGGKLCAPVFHDVAAKVPPSGQPFPIPDEVWMVPGDLASGRPGRPGNGLLAWDRQKMPGS